MPMIGRERIRRMPGIGAGAGAKENATGRFALVVSTSPVNTIVVSSAVRESGLKPVAVAPVEVADLLQSSTPSVIIVDWNPGDTALSAALDNLFPAEANNESPPVIALTSGNAADLSNYPFSAIAVMPLSIETFRPLIERHLA